MILMEKLRRDAGLSQRKLGRACEPEIEASYISQAERRGFRLYSGYAQRIADVLGYEGDPDDLFDDAEQHPDAVCRYESATDITDEEKMKLAVEYYKSDSPNELIKTAHVDLCVFLNAGMIMRSKRDGERYTIKKLHSDYVVAFGKSAPSIQCLYKIINGKTRLRFSDAVEICALIDGEFNGYTFRLLIDNYMDGIMFNLARLWSANEEQKHEEA